MTTASELFYNRRSRVSRGAETRLDLDGLSSDRDRVPVRRSFLRHRRSHFDNGDYMEHSLRPRALLRSGHEPRHSNDNSLGDSGASSGVNNGSVASERINRMVLASASNGQLPTSVLQARARLLERLRGISIPQNRDEAASSVPWDDEYWEAVVGRNSHESGRQVSTSLRHAQSPLVGRRRGFVLRTRPFMAPPGTSIYELANFDDLVERIQSQLLDFGVEESHESPVPQYCIRRSPGLSSDAIANLLHEAFKEDEQDDVGMQCDCSVCLESFEEGDGLIRLHCGHRFHTICLEPWLKTCGDCPYYRARI